MSDIKIEIISSMNKSLTEEYGKGYDVSSLYKFKSFMKAFLTFWTH